MKKLLILISLIVISYESSCSAERKAKNIIRKAKEGSGYQKAFKSENLDPIPVKNSHSYVSESSSSSETIVITPEKIQAHGYAKKQSEAGKNGKPVKRETEQKGIVAKLDSNNNTQLEGEGKYQGKVKSGYKKAVSTTNSPEPKVQYSFEQANVAVPMTK